MWKRILKVGNSLVVQCLGLGTFIVGAWFNPGWGAKTPQAAWHGQKTNNKRILNVDLKFLSLSTGYIITLIFKSWKAHFCKH